MVVVGIGALGTRAAAMLRRVGVGFVRLVDRDLVEPENLSTQELYDTRHVDRGLPKAQAARMVLEPMRGDGHVEAVVADLRPENAPQILGDVDCILDGTDNFRTRFLLNDFAVRHQIPWVFAAAVGSYGMTGPIVPGRGPCLRCLLEEPPGADQPTCDTVGLFPPVAAAVAAFQAGTAMRLLVEPRAPLPAIRRFDLWEPGDLRASRVPPRRRPTCVTCARRRFEFLDDRAETPPVSLCGRRTVQISPAKGARPVSLSTLARRLRRAGTVRANQFLLRFRGPGRTSLTVFADGRTLVHGTEDPARARTIHARYVGG